MKPLTKLVFLSLLTGIAWGQATFNYSTGQVSPTLPIDNRLSGYTTWTLTYTVSGFSKIIISLESAPTGPTGAPDSFTNYVGANPVGSNPNTASTSGTFTINGRQDWVRANVTYLLGSGNVNISITGTGGGGGGGGGGTWGTIGGVLSNQTDLQNALNNKDALGAGAAALNAANTNAANANNITSGTLLQTLFPHVNSMFGVCGDATHVGQITTTVYGQVTLCTPIAITGGGSSYTLPIATSSTLGGIKPDNISIVVDPATGTATVPSSGGSSPYTSGSGVPTANCNPGTGVVFYQDTANTNPGSNMYFCYATNSWAQLNPIGGSGALKYTVTNGVPTIDGDSTVIAFMTNPNVWPTIQTFNVGLKLVAVAFSTIPACASGTDGLLRWITDSASTTPYAVITTGGGSNKALVLCVNGIGWQIH